MDDRERIYRKWIEEVWNQRSEQALEEVFAECGIAYYPYFLKSDEPICGIEKFKEFFRLVWENFTDFNIETLDLAITDEKIISLCLIKAVQRDLDSDDPTATQEAEVKCLCQFTIEDGKIMELWNNVDLTEQNPKAALLKL
jgi:hypothetical protein